MYDARVVLNKKNETREKKENCSAGCSIFLIFLFFQILSYKKQSPKRELFTLFKLNTNILTKIKNVEAVLNIKKKPLQSKKIEHLFLIEKKKQSV
jgi:hypothetical protein